MRFLMLALCLATACGKAKTQPLPENPSSDVKTTWAQTQDRLLGMLDQGWVVSQGVDGVHDQGDSLIFTGIALGSMDCGRGQPLEKALLAMLGETGGALYRYPSLPTSISMDGALGLYLGIATRLQRCAAAATWHNPLKSHQAFMAAHGDRLNASAETVLPSPFTVVRDQVFAAAGLGGAPGVDRIQAVVEAAAAWAEGVKLEHAACFRVNLGLTALQTIQAAGGTITSSQRDIFCGATTGLGLPTVDRWCGRDGLSDYLTAFQYNQWGYRHQRCPGWETPDGGGHVQPGVDRLKGLVDQYQFDY